jgi:hypothetical protein
MKLKMLNAKNWLNAVLSMYTVCSSTVYFINVYIYLGLGLDFGSLESHRRATAAFVPLL